jgi:hypothetical protein
MTFPHQPSGSTRVWGSRIARALVLVVGVVLIGSCRETVVMPVEVATVQIVPDRPTAVVGGTVQLVAELRDDSGRPVTGHSITWTSEDQGVATVDPTGRVAGTGRGATTIRAQVGAAQGTAALQVLTPASIVLSQSQAQLVLDRDGSPPSSIQVGITNGGEAALTGMATSTEYQGDARDWLSAALSQTSAPATLILAVAEDVTLDPGRYEAAVNVSAASVTSSGAVSVLVSLEVRDGTEATGPATRLAFAQQPATTRVGMVFAPAITVRVEDADGNLASSAALVTIALGAHPPGATLVGTRTAAAVNGIATFSDLAVDRVGAGFTLQASTPSLAPATSSEFDIVAGTPSAVALTGPAAAVAGTVSEAFAVTAVDDRGNIATVSQSTTFSLGSTRSGTFFSDPAGTTAITSVSIPAGGSSAAFYYVAAALGEHTVSAASATLGAAAHALTVAAGAPAQLAFGQQPTSTGVGAILSPAVTVRIEDAQGNLVSSTASVTLALATNPSGAALGGTLTRAAVDGIATFDDLSLDEVGTGYTLAATASGLTGATSAEFNITAGAPAQLAFGQQPTSTGVGAILNPAVTVRIEDAQGNLVSSTASVTLALATNPSGAALGGTLTRAAVNGIATFDDLSLDEVGTGYTLAATASGLTGATSAGFDITVEAPVQLAFGQQPTSTEVGATLSPAVTVRIEDAQDTLVSSTASVTLGLAANPSDAVLYGTLTRAAVDGIATFDDLSLDAIGTGYTLEASAIGLTGTTSSTFDMTLIPAPTGLTAPPGQIRSNRVRLVWTDNSVRTPSFHIFRADGPEDFVLLALHTGSVQFDDFTVQPNSTYRYRVVACHISACSEPSNTITVTTPDGTN